MAEFSRRSGKRILENIDTKKSSKQEVYDFYKRSRAQLMRRGDSVDPLLKVKEVSKKDLVRAIEKLQYTERSTYLEREYTKITATATQKPPSEFARESLAFTQKLQRYFQHGELDLKKFMGGRFVADYQQIITDAEGRQKTVYRGKFAQEQVARWVDQGILADTDDYLDSDDMWEDMENVEENNDLFNLFEDNFKGKEKKHTAEYYDRFDEFREDIAEFDKELDELRKNKKKKKKIPETYSREYMTMFDEWKAARGSSLSENLKDGEKL